MKPKSQSGVAAEMGLPESPQCPFCGSGETELHSAFGSALSVATYWCRACRSAFELFKPQPHSQG